MALVKPSTEFITKIIGSIKNPIMALGPQADLIEIVYLFGSSLTERKKTNSDIDLAFLLNYTEYKRDPVKAVFPAYRIGAELGIEFDRQTDVTILNSSSLEIAYEVVTIGKCIYEKDRDTRLDYESKTRGMYFDFKPFLDQFRAKVIDNL